VDHHAILSGSTAEYMINDSIWIKNASQATNFKMPQLVQPIKDWNQAQPSHDQVASSFIVIIAFDTGKYVNASSFRIVFNDTFLRDFI
jgi:hypothetical protein